MSQNYLEPYALLVSGLQKLSYLEYWNKFLLDSFTSFSCAWIHWNPAKTNSRKKILLGFLNTVQILLASKHMKGIN